MATAAVCNALGSCEVMVSLLQVEAKRQCTPCAQCINDVSAHEYLNGIFAGSSERTVKLWDMRAGMPLATSKLHGGTVRCLAVDEDMLVSGSSDHKLRVWLADRNSKAGFDLSDPIRLAKGGHTGPVAAVALDGQ